MSIIRVPHLGQDGQAMTDGKYLRCSAIFSTLLLAERDTDADFSGGLLLHLQLNRYKMVIDSYRY